MDELTNYPEAVGLTNDFHAIDVLIESEAVDMEYASDGINANNSSSGWDLPGALANGSRKTVARQNESHETTSLPVKARESLFHIQRSRISEMLPDPLLTGLDMPVRFGQLIGASPIMQRLYQQINKVAPTDATVFIIGDSGTGKELAAETLHQLSTRNEAPFLPVNCGAISSHLIESEMFGHEKGSFTGAHRQHIGFFERAHGGTLFLDEITEMPLELQVKLLRVLETRRFTRVGGGVAIPLDVRIIAASNRNPVNAVAEGRLREDLMYRLHVFPLQMPLLQERGDDIPMLARHFLEQLNVGQRQGKRLGPGVVERLRQMPWPGNVRQLKNAIQRAWILADDHTIAASCFGEPVSHKVNNSGPVLNISIGKKLADIEKAVILATLRECSGRREEAASILGLSLKTLYNRLREYRVTGLA